MPYHPGPFLVFRGDLLPGQLQDFLLSFFYQNGYFAPDGDRVHARFGGVRDIVREAADDLRKQVQALAS